MVPGRQGGWEPQRLGGWEADIPPLLHVHSIAAFSEIGDGRAFEADAEDSEDGAFSLGAGLSTNMTAPACTPGPKSDDSFTD